MKQAALPILAILCIVTGLVALNWDGVVIGPAEVVIVAESSDTAKLTKEQVVMIQSLARDNLVRRADPNDTGPSVPQWAIDAAKGKIPAWATRYGGSKVVVVPLPPNRAAADVLLKRDGVIQ